MMDLERLRNLLSDSLRDVPYDRIEIHLENNLLYDRAREIMDACTRLRTHDGQPIDTVIVSAQADSDDHVAPTIEKEPSEPGSGDPVQIGFEDGKS